MSVSFNKQLCEKALRECYHDATCKGGLIEFTQQIRTYENNFQGKYSVTQEDLTKLFSEKVWRDCKKVGGHRKIENIVTGTVIEYANHDNSRGIDPGAVMTIFSAVQEHLNILCNQIFAYKINNWKNEPDYLASVERFIALKK
ncbi:MAG: hypothetical protein WCG10_06585 [Chlamydiota bacterium]